MEKLRSIIEDIVRWGLYPNLEINDKVTHLEESLVKLYSMYFDVIYNFDIHEYPNYEKPDLPDLRGNIASNFPDFGFYHIALDIHQIQSSPSLALGDSTDDLADIIFDLLEVRWRFDNNSESDAWWCFESNFKTHTQQHLLNLLTYIKSKSSH